jgi:hypothetical protein
VTGCWFRRGLIELFDLVSIQKDEEVIKELWWDVSLNPCAIPQIYVGVSTGGDVGTAMGALSTETEAEWCSARSPREKTHRGVDFVCWRAVLIDTVQKDSQRFEKTLAVGACNDGNSCKGSGFRLPISLPRLTLCS